MNSDSYKMPFLIVQLHNDENMMHFLYDFLINAFEIFITSIWYGKLQHICIIEQMSIKGVLYIL